MKIIVTTYYRLIFIWYFTAKLAGQICLFLLFLQSENSVKIAYKVELSHIDCGLDSKIILLMKELIQYVS